MAMDKHVRRLIIGLGLPVAAAFLVEQVPKRGTVEIPFSFQVEDQTLPAGPYSIKKSARQGTIWIQNQRTPAAATRLTVSGRKWGKADGAKLVFECYDNRHFLSEIWFSADSAGLTLNKGHLEEKLAAAPAERAVASVKFD
jgi:hypothetical protein